MSPQITQITYDSGQTYQGEFLNRLCHGLGRLTYPNHDYLLGMFYLDEFQLVGQYHYADGSVYEGTFRPPQDQFQFPFDEGQLTLSSGHMYKGIFTPDLSLGTIIYPNGDVYTGEIRKYLHPPLWLPYGNGKLVESTGLVHLGDFVEGLLTGGMIVDPDPT